jgi:MoaA/NifB/PqqE/SkfB family radical SAM enzyme
MLTRLAEFLMGMGQIRTAPSESARKQAPSLQREKLFCSKPFTWFEVSRGREEGEVYLCCPTWLNKPVGNLTRESVEEVWNGPAAQEIRRSILDGSFKYCSFRRCPHLQRIDGPVQRLEDVRDPDLLDVIRDGLTVLPYGPREVNCSFDRSCNLSCPSCRTKLIMETKSKERILGIQERISKEALADARLLYITGSGDPFGSPFFRRWLQTMKRSDMPNLEIIHLHTNGLLWSPRMWQTIPAEIRSLVKWADVSIDAGTAETYKINRRGGDFATLLSRLEFISSLRRHGPLEWFGINMTVQRNNFEEMIEFLQLGHRLGCDTVAFHQISNWGTFSADEFRERAVHLPDHPDHAAFLRVLNDPALDDPIAYTSNLTALRNTAPVHVDA